MIRLLVEKKRGVAEHAHVLETTENALLVDFREPALSFPFAHQSGEYVILLPVGLRLLRSQGHVQNLVGALGKILQNLLPGAPQEDRRQLFVNSVKPTVADQFAVLVLGPMLV